MIGIDRLGDEMRVRSKKKSDNLLESTVAASFCGVDYYRIQDFYHQNAFVQGKCIHAKVAHTLINGENLRSSSPVQSERLGGFFDAFLYIYNFRNLGS